MVLCRTETDESDAILPLPLGMRYHRDYFVTLRFPTI